LKNNNHTHYLSLLKNYIIPFILLVLIGLFT